MIAVDTSAASLECRFRAVIGGGITGGAVYDALIGMTASERS